MIKSVLKKPYIFFCGLAILTLISSFFSKDITLDINVHDTYFIIYAQQLEQLGIFYFLLVGFNYFALHWMNRKPIFVLTILHLLLQSIALVMLYSSTCWNWIGHNKKLEQFNIINDNSNIVIVLSILVFLLSFFIHFLNFIIPIFLKRE